MKPLSLFTSPLGRPIAHFRFKLLLELDSHSRQSFNKRLKVCDILLFCYYLIHLSIYLLFVEYREGLKFRKK